MNRARAIAGSVFFIALLMFTLFNWALPRSTSAAVVQMMLFWDGTGNNAPTGWKFIDFYSSEYVGRYPRGNEPSKVAPIANGNDGYICDPGVTGNTCFAADSDDLTATRATRPLTPAAASASVTATNVNDNLNSGGSGATNVPNPHGHVIGTGTLSTSIAFGTDSNGSLPASRRLRIIVSNGNMPTTIPAGAIAMFDSTPGMPTTNWTRYWAQDGRFPFVTDSNTTTGATGIGTTTGGDTVTNTIGGDATTNGSPSISQKIRLAGSTETIARSTLFASTPTAGPGHTHTVPNGTTPSLSALPPYVQPIMAKANSDQPAGTNGLIAMFDGNPGAGWSIKSASGQPFHKRLLRPGATYNTGSGDNTHTPSYTANTDSISGAAGPNTSSGVLQAAADTAHTHTVQVTASPVSNIPPYFNVVFAEKVALVFEQYRWFVDNGTATPTDPWSSLDLPPNTEIAATPVANDNPDRGRVLRLRVQISTTIGSTIPNDGTVKFKLQYLEGQSNDCYGTSSDVWTDLDTATGNTLPWAYASVMLLDPVQLTSSAFTGTPILEVLTQAPTTGNVTNAIGSGQTFEYDFAIKNVSAPSSTRYSFRVVEVDNPGTVNENSPPLGSYGTPTPKCPALTTLPGIEDEMRHGKTFVGAEAGFQWVD